MMDNEQINLEEVKKDPVIDKWLNNKQVSIWRGNDEPPTKYHIWITKFIIRQEPLIEEWILRLFNGVEWVPFINDAEIAAQIGQALEKIAALETRVVDLENNTINGYLIKDNPILNASDLLTSKSGLYVKENDNVADALMIVDELLKTQEI